MKLMVLTKKHLLFAFAWFIVGVILGVTSSMLYSGWTIDQKVIELDTLYSEISERDSRIERLEDSLADHRYRVVNSLKIQLNIKDAHLNLKISDALRALLGDLIGEEIASLDPILIRNIIDNRIIFVNNQPYSCRLVYLLIAETISVEVEVTITE